MALLSLVQSAVLVAAIGLRAPYVEAAVARSGPLKGVGHMVRSAVVLGVVTGAVILVIDPAILPHWPQRLLEMARQTTVWENITAALYGGINEELLMRLFGMSVLLWLLSRIWLTPTGQPTNACFWTVNVVMTILFGLGHLPAARGLLGSITPFIFTRTLVLNALIGLVCGWLFWTSGIEAAIVAHFSADIMYHVIGTIVFTPPSGRVLSGVCLCDPALT